MAMQFFRSSPLPMPPADYNPQYIKELVRALELYFSQMDSNTPNYADSYTATAFYGMPVAANVTTAQRTALTVQAGSVVFDTNLKKLCLYTGTAWQVITSA
jgi:hypothetical protein